MDNAHREEALFNCLTIPNDDVKLAVVDCLYYVPITQIEADEMDMLLKMISPQNVGAGKTELVLSVIFSILSNLISCHNAKSLGYASKTEQNKAIETSKLFKSKFSYTAISLAIMILIKNQQRNIDDFEEEKEKITLSLAIINFLKHVSKDRETVK